MVVLEGLISQRYGGRVASAGCAFVLVGCDFAAIVAVLVLGPGFQLFAVVSIPILLTARWLAGGYRSLFTRSAVDEAPRALVALLAAVAAVALAVQLTGAGQTDEAVALASIIALLLVLLRAPIYALIHAVERRTGHSTRVILVGQGVVAQTIQTKAGEARDGPVTIARTMPDLTAEDVVAVARAEGVSTVLIAFSSTPEAREIGRVRDLLAAGIRVYAVPRFFDLIASARADDQIWGMPVVRVGRTPTTRGSVVKRLADVTLAAMALLLLWPVILVAGLLVKRETHGSMFFRQVRVGRRGGTFTLLKLQTMAPVSPDEADTTWTVGGGERVGPVGGFLRRTSVDELPQLWNILVGDMSFVGPRPERPYFVERFSQEIPDYDQRHRVPVGLTGLAQIYDLRGDTDIGERALVDNRYADDWSLWEDLRIVLKTVPKVLKGAGK